MKKLEIINQKFGKLLVISEHSKTRNGHLRYTCLCDCGNYHNVLATHLRRYNTTSCGCDKPIGENHAQWTGVGEMSGAFWQQHILRSAIGDSGRRVLEVTLKKEEAYDIYLKQDKKCALSGLPIKFPSRQGDKTYTASLDRIDSSLGYIKGNVQWVNKYINIMKNKFNNEYFINTCRAIAENNPISKEM